MNVAVSEISYVPFFSPPSGSCCCKEPLLSASLSSTCDFSWTLNGYWNETWVIIGFIQEKTHTMKPNRATKYSHHGHFETDQQAHWTVFLFKLLPDLWNPQVAFWTLKTLGCIHIKPMYFYMGVMVWLYEIKPFDRVRSKLPEACWSILSCFNRMMNPLI